MDGAMYSKGMHAEVSLLTEKQKVLFPAADLQRVEKREDPYCFLRLFYKHRIAHILFPNHFIDVVGATSRPVAGSSNPYSREVSLFSKKAPVMEDHAVYAAHMELRRIENINRTVKISDCKCDICSRHKKFHIEQDVVMRSLEDRNAYDWLGISVPWDDDSDYCVTPKGEIFYFEIEKFDRDILRNRLEDIPDEAVRLTVKRMLDRYDHYFHLSRQGMLAGKHSVCF